ncbi:hypothetical protein Prudu_017308, partial [Prunus dulcis]
MEDGGERKIHWLVSDRHCAPKDEGLLQYSDSLTSKILKAKYFPSYSFLDAPVKTTGSFAWKSICAARPILLQGSRWQVGSGEGIDIWKDRWVPRAITFSVITPKPTECTLSQVQELIRQNTRTWDLPFLAT